MAGLVARPTAQIAAVPLHLQALGTARNQTGVDAGCRQILLHLLAAGAQAIDPQIQRRHLVAGGRHGGRPLNPAPVQQ